MAINQIQELVVHGIRAVTALARERLPCAMMQVIPHELARHAPQRLLHGRDLHDNVGAIAILFDHLVQAADLPFDPAKPLQVGGLDRRIDASRLSCRTSASLPLNPITSRVCHRKDDRITYPHRV